MFYFIAEKITSFLLDKGYIIKELQEVYRYGFEILISSIFGCLLVISLGFISSSLPESIIFLICLISLRRYTGGYHASSYFKCNLMLLGSYVICLFLYRILYDFKFLFFVLSLVLFLPFLFVIVRFSPLENINKKISYNEKKQYNLISRNLFFLYYIFSILLTTLNISLGIFVFVVISLVVVTMIIEIIKQRLINYEKQFFKNDS